jgi:cis-L-3-hydroxyproline dehydratase
MRGAESSAAAGTTIHAAQVLVAGEASGPVVASRQMLSFWGGVDPATGTVIDHRHPWRGRCLAGAIVVLPKGRGSSTGSYVLLDSLAAGVAPAGILTSQIDEIIALGVVVQEEFNGRGIPVLVLNDSDFEVALVARQAVVFTDGRVVLDG